MRRMSAIGRKRKLNRVVKDIYANILMLIWWCLTLTKQIHMNKFANVLLGNVLVKLRKDAGMSQQKLAHASGLDRTYISMLERGLRLPTLQTIFDLSCALDIKASELVELIVEDISIKNKYPPQTSVKNTKPE